MALHDNRVRSVRGRPTTTRPASEADTDVIRELYEKLHDRRHGPPRPRQIPPPEGER